MMLFITIIAFILILSFLFLTHELGHFLAAKRVGVPVLEFGIGFPPAILKLKRKETTYSLNIIPFGAFVRILGMDDLKEKNPKSYWNQSILKRFLIAFGGPLSNLFWAWIILTISLWIFLVIPAKNFIVVQEIVPGSPAEQAGIKQGDLIVKGDDLIFGKSEEVTQFTKSHKGEEAEIVIKRFGGEIKKQVRLSNKEAPLGIAMIDASSGEKTPAIKAPLTSLLILAESIYITVLYMGKAIVAVFTPQKIPFEISGPVGVYGYVSQFATMGYYYLFRLTAFLSLALGFFNLLPLPALDGGRLTFLILEKIFGKKVVRPEIENTIHSVGFIALLGIMILITYKDIINLIKR